jgi:hypothetical protein
MKKFHKYFLPLLLVILIAFVSTCKKDDDDEPPTFESLSFNEEEVINRIPEGLKNSTDENAQTCVSYIETAASWSAFEGFMDPPSDAEKVSGKSTNSQGTWKWTIPHQGYQITFYWTYEETATKHIWTMDVQYADGPLYNFIDAWELKDGTQGEVKYNFQWACVYDPDYYDDCEDLLYIYTWNMNASGVINYTLVMESSEVEYAYYYRYELVVNPDGSGTLDRYWLDAFWHYHFEWDAQGNGSWVWYSEGGTISGSGSWTV